MGTLIKKIWWYRPNAYTTTFTLTATFGNSESEYVFQKTEESWEAIGTHDSRLVIIMPNDTNGQRFLVRAYVEDPFVDLNATYANATSQSTAREVGLKRIVFDKTFFDTHTFEPNCNFENPFDLFNDSDLDDIYFTTITTHITLPDKIYDYGAWYGWGAYNETKPYSEMILNPDNKYIMPLSWIYSWKLTGYPTVGINDSTSSHPNIDKLVEAPMVDNKLYFVPLYHYENKQFDIDTHDYTPPTPPTPTGDYMYFEAAQSNSTVSLTSTLATAPNLEYSTDGVNWQKWQHTTADGTHTFDTLTLTAVGDRVYLRGDNPDGLGTMTEGAEMPSFSHFEMTGKIAAGGNIMSLLDKDAEMTEVPVFGFVSLFGDLTGENPNTSLTTAAAMPAVTSIGAGGCFVMYQGCTSLTTAADMPAVTSIGESGCTEMYVHCTSLTTAADMPAVTSIGESGCNGMYAHCTSLTTAADMPAVTSIGEDGCTGMYQGCTFNMSDNGTTLNFDFPTPPITAGETTYSTAYDIAEWMGNTNGFTNP